jgi:hypothetical protein
MSRPFIYVTPVFLMSLACMASKNPVAHVDIEVTNSYEGQQALPKPDRVVVYDFAVSKSVVQTDKTPGIRQRMKVAHSSEDAATYAGEQVEHQITKDMMKGLEKRLKTAGITVEKGTPETKLTGNTLVIHGTITKLNQGHRLRRGTVGLGAGASNVETECQISMQTDGQAVLLSALTTKAKSGKKPGMAVTMGAGAAPAVAGGVTGATAHKSTPEGDASRTGSALAKHIANLMKTKGWIPAEAPQTTDVAQSNQ